MESIYEKSINLMNIFCYKLQFIFFFALIYIFKIEPEHFFRNKLTNKYLCEYSKTYSFFKRFISLFATKLILLKKIFFNLIQLYNNENLSFKLR